MNNDNEIGQMESEDFFLVNEDWDFCWLSTVSNKVYSESRKLMEHEWGTLKNGKSEWSACTRLMF